MRGRRRLVRGLVVASLFLGGATLVWLRWGTPREVAALVADELGMRLVAGHREWILEAAAESGVQPELVAAIMFSESRGRVGARSSAGALGLMQLTPGAASDAARRLALPAPSEADLLRDGRLNVRLGARHLRWLLDNAGDWDAEAVLVSYNAGRTKLMRWIEREGGYAAWRDAELRKARAGQEHTGCVQYARQTLRVRDEFVERGVFAAAE
jgi:soluble lytic murein transglycosylase-like protein